MNVTASILDLIGNTPLIRIEPKGRWTNGVTVLAKLEGFNPGGSVKDRPARNIVREAADDGSLNPGGTIIDSSSGNTGIALAMIGNALGYPVELVMPSNVTEERKRLADAYGAKVIFSDPMLGSDGAIVQVREIVDASPGAYFYSNQYNNPANPRAHEKSTAPEIIEQTAGKVTHFAAALGTSGTLMGTGRGLKALKPDVTVVALEPAESLHGIEGLKHMESAITPEIYDESFADEKLSIGTEDAYDWTLWLRREQGLFLGHSSGAAIAGAARIAQGLNEGVIVTIFPDGGEKYLSVPL